MAPASCQFGFFPRKRLRWIRVAVIGRNGWSCIPIVPTIWAATPRVCPASAGSVLKECDGAVDEVTNDIVEFSVNLPFKFFPGEVRVPLFGPEANDRVAPVFSVFKLKRFVYPDAYLLALRESLSFELYVFCGGYFPRQIVSLVAGQ